MSSDDNEKKVSQLPAKARMAAAKERQPQIVAQVRVFCLANGAVQVERPECINAEDFAKVIDLMATGIKVVAQAQAKQLTADSRIYRPGPGAVSKLNG